MLKKKRISMNTVLLPSSVNMKANATYMCRLKLSCFDKASLSQTGLCKGGLADWSVLHKESLLNSSSPSRWDPTPPLLLRASLIAGREHCLDPWSRPQLAWLDSPLGAALPAVSCPTLCAVVRSKTQRDRPGLEINCGSHRGLQPQNATKHERCAELPGEKVKYLA